jgi:predicted ATP-grasp superfamily ATP-dependent carboligase
MTETKNILITAGRSPITLDLARQFKAASHNVFVTETTRIHLCTFSNAIKKAFVIPSPRFEPDAFIDALVKTVTENDIDLLIPSWEETLNISMNKDKFPKSCKIYCSSFDVIHELHNKWDFIQKLNKLEIPTPKTVLIENKQDLQDLDFSTPYILKPCYSRASQKVCKVLPTEAPPNIEIESHNPWIAQEWLDGKKFCTYTLCHDGELKAHSTYPVGYSIDGNSCLTFEAVEHKKIYEWIKTFVKAQNFTGQVGFDFVEKADGSIYAFECNPRSTSGAHLFDPQDRLDLAFLNQNVDPILPLKGRTRQFACGMLMYGWRALPPEKTKLSYLWELISNKDIIFNKGDLLPTFTMPLLAFKYVSASRKMKERLISTFYFDLDWNNDTQRKETPEPVKP